jgi:hypothetical protein
VLSPAEADPLSFSEGLFSRANLSIPKRLAATLIAAVFLSAGSALLARGFRSGSMLFGGLGLLTIIYGLGWGRAACWGRLRDGRLRLNPWDGK